MLDSDLFNLNPAKKNLDSQRKQKSNEKFDNFGSYNRKD